MGSIPTVIRHHFMLVVCIFFGIQWLVQASPDATFSLQGKWQSIITFRYWKHDFRGRLQPLPLIRCRFSSVSSCLFLLSRQTIVDDYSLYINVHTLKAYRVIRCMSWNSRRRLLPYNAKREVRRGRTLAVNLGCVSSFATSGAPAGLAKRGTLRAPSASRSWVEAPSGYAPGLRAGRVA